MIKIHSLHDLHDEETLREVILGGETSTLEFRRDTSDTDNTAKLMSSFANTDGGIILFGMDSDGTILGVKNVEHFDDFAQKAFLKTTPVGFATRLVGGG